MFLSSRIVVDSDEWILADLPQFFPGKLYEPVLTLKLPAEELLWSALPSMHHFILRLLWILDHLCL